MRTRRRDRQRTLQPIRMRKEIPPYSLPRFMPAMHKARIGGIVVRRAHSSWVGYFDVRAGTVWVHHSATYTAAQ